MLLHLQRQSCNPASICRASIYFPAQGPLFQSYLPHYINQPLYIKCLVRNWVENPHSILHPEATCIWKLRPRFCDFTVSVFDGLKQGRFMTAYCILNNNWRAQRFKKTKENRKWQWDSTQGVQSSHFCKLMSVWANQHASTSSQWNHHPGHYWIDMSFCCIENGFSACHH